MDIAVLLLRETCAAFQDPECMHTGHEELRMGLL